jgi:HEAT repeat protein
MTGPLDRALEALRPDRELRPEELRPLSDLDSQSRQKASAGWADLPAERRAEIMALCGELAREHIELNFDWLARLGLGDADPDVRRRAIANLWECDEGDLPAVLLGLLENDPNLEVRVQAAAALERFVYQAEVSDASPEWRRALNAGLLAASRSSERALALKALEALGHSSDPAVAELIDQAYAAGDEGSVRSALLAMGRTGDERWARFVIAEMRHPSPLLRAESARAAGELELRSSVPELLELLRDVNPEVQRAAVWSLGQIGGRRAARALERLAQRGDDAPLAAAAEEALDLLAFVEETRKFEAGLGLRDDVE